MKTKKWTAWLLLLSFISLGTVFSGEMVFAKPSTGSKAIPKGKSHTSSTQKINLNSASEKDLAKLPGIGPKKALAITAYRRNHPFQKVEDLMGVEGIGQETLKEIRPMVTVK